MAETTTSPDHDAVAVQLEGREKARRSHITGIVLISCVAFLWVGSSELTQVIYGESDFDKPLFLTYFTISFFAVYLVGFLRASWRAALRAPSFSNEYKAVENDSQASTPNEELAGSLAKDPELAGAVEKALPLNGRTVLRAAFAIGPVFFLADYTFNWCLGRTTVASSSTIATTSTLFSLLLGALMGAERFSVPKLVSSVMTILGVAIISRHDSKGGKGGGMLGDLGAVLAAMLYSLYTVLFKLYFPSEGSSSDTAMLFGIIGGFVAITLWPLLFLFDLAKWETFTLPTTRTLGLLSINAVLGTVLSDYLWALSVSLTTPVIATLALSLTLPLSLLCDYVFRSVKFTTPYIFGVLLVLGGVIAANIDEALARGNAQEQ
jgi:solute carrier family 35, member F5